MIRRCWKRNSSHCDPSVDGDVCRWDRVQFDTNATSSFWWGPSRLKDLMADYFPGIEVDEMGDDEWRVTTTNPHGIVTLRRSLNPSFNSSVSRARCLTLSPGAPYYSLKGKIWGRSLSQYCRNISTRHSDLFENPGFLLKRTCPRRMQIKP